MGMEAPKRRRLQQGQPFHQRLAAIDLVSEIFGFKSAVRKISGLVSRCRSHSIKRVNRSIIRDFPLAFVRRVPHIAVVSPAAEFDLGNQRVREDVVLALQRHHGCFRLQCVERLLQIVSIFLLEARTAPK